MHKLIYFFRSIILSIKMKSIPSRIVSVLGFPAAFLPMLISLKLAAFTDVVQQLFGNPALLQTAILSFAGLAFIYLGQAAFNAVQSYYVKEDAARIKRYIKEETMSLLCTVSYKYIENYEDFYEKVSLVKTYGGVKTAGSISLILGWLAKVISFVSVAAVLFSVNPWIVFVLIAACVPAAVLSMLQKDETYRMRTKWMKEGKLTIHYSDICRMNEPMKEIRFFGLYPYIKQKWRDLSEGYIDKKKNVTGKHVLYNSIADIIRNGVYFIVILITVWEIYHDPARGLGTFMLVISSAGQLQSVTTILLVHAVSIFSDVKYIEDFFRLLEMERESEDTDVAQEAGIYERVDIHFEDVSFTYPNNINKALDSVTVKIRQGEKIAIVGANGSGKSTFISLLCGFYQPDSGNIYINGQEIKRNLKKLRRSVSAIFQKFCQYQDTLRNNIAISDPGRSREDNKILSLARSTGADGVIKDQKNTLDEMVGIFSDTGNNLSGGQWQKIAITRALYRENACVCILDEPTAALDPLGEANIYRNFRQLTGDKTTILISHRLGITSVVDRILVFDRGRIVEDGSHTELMEQNGLYAKMYRAQARWYT